MGKWERANQVVQIGNFSVNPTGSTHPIQEQMVNVPLVIKLIEVECYIG